MTPNPGDWPLHVRSRLIVMGIGIVAFVFFQLLSLAPGLVEVVYATTIGPLIVQPLSRLTGLFPFSIVELCVVAYIVWLGVLSFKTVRAVVGKRRNVSNAVLGGGLRLARDAGVYVALFYFLWGLNIDSVSRLCGARASGVTFNVPEASRRERRHVNR